MSPYKTRPLHTNNSFFSICKSKKRTEILCLLYANNSWSMLMLKEYPRVVLCALPHLEIHLNLLELYIIKIKLTSLTDGLRKEQHDSYHLTRWGNYIIEHFSPILVKSLAMDLRICLPNTHITLAISQPCSVKLGNFNLITTLSFGQKIKRAVYHNSVVSFILIN